MSLRKTASWTVNHSSQETVLHSGLLSLSYLQRMQPGAAPRLLSDSRDLKHMAPSRSGSQAQNKWLPEKQQHFYWLCNRVVYAKLL